MSVTVYRIGDRCPDCGQHFRELAQLLPTTEEYEAWGLPLKALPAEAVRVVCPKGHEHEPHPDWLKRPFPTPVFEP